MAIQTNYSKWNVENLIENKYTLRTVQAQRRRYETKFLKNIICLLCLCLLSQFSFLKKMCASNNHFECFHSDYDVFL